MDLLRNYGIDFSNSKLINTALTHTSYSNEHNVPSYERLEYLGDAALELVFSNYIYKNTNLNPGEMSRLRSLYVCENALFEYSKKINLSKYIKLGNGLTEANKTVIADVFEAVFAVIYLENGIEECEKLFKELIIPFINEETDFLKDYKSLLQEQTQTEKRSIKYKVVKESGPAHKKVFEVHVYIDNILFGKGIGNSKKEAEQKAAKNAFSKHAG